MKNPDVFWVWGSVGLLGFTRLPGSHCAGRLSSFRADPGFFPDVPRGAWLLQPSIIPPAGVDSSYLPGRCGVTWSQGELENSEFGNSSGLCLMPGRQPWAALADESRED